MRIHNFEEYQKVYQYSIEHPEDFWNEIAQHFHWRKKWDKVLEWNFTEPRVKWFINGKLNITENCLDIPAQKHPDKIAFYFEPNDPNDLSYSITYKELLEKVCQLSNALKEIGVQKGDRVAIYMPMIPEAVIAMLACARIGAIHSVVFGGFSAQSLADRINDAECKVLITADGGKRGNKIVHLKQTADEALQQTHSIEHVLVLKHIGVEINIQQPRDIWWDDIVSKQSTYCEPEIMDSEDMLFILYTSGSTGKPKGVVHTTAVIWYILLIPF